MYTIFSVLVGRVLRLQMFIISPPLKMPDTYTGETPGIYNLRARPTVWKVSYTDTGPIHQRTTVFCNQISKYKFYILICDLLKSFRRKVHILNLF